MGAVVEGHLGAGDRLRCRRRGGLGELHRAVRPSWSVMASAGSRVPPRAPSTPRATRRRRGRKRQVWAWSSPYSPPPPHGEQAPYRPESENSPLTPRHPYVMPLSALQPSRSTCASRVQVRLPTVMRHRRVISAPDVLQPQACVAATACDSAAGVCCAAGNELQFAREFLMRVAREWSERVRRVQTRCSNQRSLRWSW